MTPLVNCFSYGPKIDPSMDLWTPTAVLEKVIFLKSVWISFWESGILRGGAAYTASPAMAGPLFKVVRPDINLAGPLFGRINWQI